MNFRKYLKILTNSTMRTFRVRLCGNYIKIGAKIDERRSSLQNQKKILYTQSCGAVQRCVYLVDLEKMLNKISTNVY